MTIYSNTPVPKEFSDKNGLKSYDFMIDCVLGDGLDDNGKIFVNINDVKDIEEYDLEASDIFDSLDEQGVTWFTTNREAPEFGEKCYDRIEDWYLEQTTVSNEISATTHSESQDTGIIQPEQIKNSHPNTDENSNLESNIRQLMDESLMVEDESASGVKEEEDLDAKIIVFGSSKGGTGKTFTSIMSTYRYAQTHPDKRIALVDFDLIDGQVGISIHKVKPTMRNYYNSYLKDESTPMRSFSVQSRAFPNNVDFYLAPSNGEVVKDDDFWYALISNLAKSYDLVVFDTGIDYLNIAPISYVYKIADKINLVTTTSIKSVTSVSKQISKLKGETPNATYEPGEIDNIINVIITQMVQNDNMNQIIYSKLQSQANVIATFGVITESVSAAEFYGRWNIFDKNEKIMQTFDNIMSL